MVMKNIATAQNTFCYNNAAAKEKSIKLLMNITITYKYTIK
jgi:hypothetical protein